MSVDPKRRPPLRPFNGAEELATKVQEIFARISPDLGGTVGLLKKCGLLDLDSRKGKAPGGYQAALDEARLPFIFMNAAGLHRDVLTLLHECGHAFHSLAVRGEALLLYRQPPSEFCEWAAMSMELLGAEHMEALYDRAEARRARREQLEGIVGLLCWVATIDAFQHWLYTHPGHSRVERVEEWSALLRRFGGIESWRGFEEAKAHAWLRQVHIFYQPFYYIEYGIAEIGALQFWRRAKRDKEAALRKYRYALSLGRSCPLPSLFRAAGLRLGFSEREIGPLARGLRRDLRALDDA
jgi:oligoendopeptidase F